MVEETYFCALLASSEDDNTYVKVVETVKRELYVKFCLIDNDSKSEKNFKITPLEFFWIIKNIRNEALLLGRFQFQNINILKEDDVYRTIIVDLHSIDQMEIELSKFKNYMQEPNRIKFIFDKDCKINLIKNIPKITKILICKNCFY